MEKEMKLENGTILLRIEEKADGSLDVRVSFEGAMNYLMMTLATTNLIQTIEQITDIESKEILKDITLSLKKKNPIEKVGEKDE